MGCKIRTSALCFLAVTVFACGRSADRTTEGSSAAAPATLQATTPESTPTIVPSPTSTPRLAVLTRVVIGPQSVVLEPKQRTTFAAQAFDQDGLQMLASFSWEVSPESGTITDDGRFEANVKAGQYPNAVTLLAEFEGASIRAVAAVEIVPGPIHSVDVTPSTYELYTGDSVEFQHKALDLYGNRVLGNSVRWTADGGEIDNSGRFVASRMPGVFDIGVRVADDRGQVESGALVRVAQGYCDTVPVKATWDFEWLALEQDAAVGGRLGVETVPLNFERDWGSGPVYADRVDRAILRATANIVVQRQGPVLFLVGGDDGFRLSLDGAVLLSDWDTHSYREKSILLDLVPGIYKLALDYFEWTGQAHLTFRTDQDIVQWRTVTTCRGRYSESPTERYFTYGSLREPVPSLAERFDVPGESIVSTRTSTGTIYLVPGPPSDGIKVVVLSGLGSSASCEEADVGFGVDNTYTRRRAMVRAIQTFVGKPTNSVSQIDDQDLVWFSYSGRYTNCDTGQSYSGANLPVTARSNFATNGAILPEYDADDTCTGVKQAADRLELLSYRLVATSPGTNILIVGHSLGGMVATYYLSQQSVDFVLSRIRGVVTLDSPIGGDHRTPPRSPCSPDAQSWRDIHGESDVVSSITTVVDPRITTRIVNANSTDIGDELPGAAVIGLECAAGPLTGGAILGAVVTSVLFPGYELLGLLGGGSLGLYGEGHSCGFYDAGALSVISQFANAEFSPPR